MAKKYLTVKDPAIEALFNEIFNNIDLGVLSNANKAGNLAAAYYSVTDSAAADSKITISHTLDKVPDGFITVKIDKGAVVYDEGTAWTTTAMYLACNVANTAFTVLVW